MYRKFIDILINIIIPLALSVIIYYFCRKHSIYFLNYIDEYLNLNKQPAVVLPSWIIYNLPDGLWNFAFTSTIIIIWKRELNNKNLIWILLPVLIAIIFEFYFGTFDKLDMIFITIGGILPIIINTKIKILLTKNRVYYESKDY